MHAYVYTNNVDTAQTEQVRAKRHRRVLMS
jgi:hypothetical protein